MPATDGHSSKVHPGLDRSPKQNWVDKAGGLPPYIDRIAKHLESDQGMTRQRAIATAVNAAKKMCATGDLNFSGKQNVNPGSRAQACAAVREWESMKAKSGVTKGKKPMVAKGKKAPGKGAPFGGKQAPPFGAKQT